MFGWLRKVLPAPRSAVLVAGDVKEHATALENGQTLAEQEGEGVSSDALKAQGDRFLKEGDLHLAEDCYRRVLESIPTHADALVNLGFVLGQTGRWSEARRYLARALEIAPHDADAHYLLAGAEQGSGNLQGAASYLKKALSLRPEFEVAYRDLVGLLLETDQVSEATQWCDRGLAAHPHCADLYLYRSFIHAQSNQIDSAIGSCRRALKLRTGPTATRLLSGLLAAARAAASSESTASIPIANHPSLDVMKLRAGLEAREAAAPEADAEDAVTRELAEAYCDLGVAYHAMYDFAQAENAYREAIALAPGVAHFHYCLGTTLGLRQSEKAARASLETAIALDPDRVLARWARALSHNAAFPASLEEAERERSGLMAALDEYRVWWQAHRITGDQFVGLHAPFFLSYQECDNKAPLERHGSLCSQAMDEWWIKQAFARPNPGSSGRIRVGIVSNDIREHSVWYALIKGWIRHLDRTRFELGVFSLSEIADEELEWARTRTDHLVTGPHPLAPWVAAITDWAPAILIYPAIGLDPLTWQLASLRLAAVQMNSWGHPDTSGLPTVDYYLSGAAFEPANAQQFYSERLVPLAGTGSAYQVRVTAQTPPDFAALQIDPNRPILICPGSPFKYQAMYDRVLIEIARKLPQSQLVFFHHRPDDLTEQLHARLVQAFAASGLEFDRHARFVPNQSLARFHGLMSASTVFLDTIGFSGYNNAIQAIECGLPVVTREGGFLRGRLASGILRTMGLEELIAADEGAYIDLAVRLASDQPYRERIRSEIVARRGVLVDDVGAIRSLEAFLIEVTSKPSTASTSGDLSGDQSSVSG